MKENSKILNDPIFKSLKNVPKQELWNERVRRTLVPKLLLGNTFSEFRLLLVRSFNNNYSTASLRLWLRVAIIVLWLLLGTSSIICAAETITLNNAVGTNEVFFFITAPGQNINGTATNISGTFQIDLNKLEATTGKITVAVNSMETGIHRRDEHMRSEEWLNADKYPYIDYYIKSLKDVQQVSNDQSSGKIVFNATAVGSFYIHGVMKDVQAKITITYIRESPETQKRASGNLVLIQAEFNINISDFDITGAGDLLRNTIGKVVNVKANLYGNGK